MYRGQKPQLLGPLT